MQITIDLGMGWLEEEKHFSAFEHALSQFFSTLIAWCGAGATARLVVVYELAMKASDETLHGLLEQSSFVARSLYYSENDEFTIEIASGYPISRYKARVVMDPVIFYLTSERHPGSQGH